MSRKKKAKWPQAKLWRLMQECVENGLRSGWNKAHKHTDTPGEDTILGHQQNYIELELSEAFDFQDEYED